MAEPKWSHESELGISLIGGNSDTQNAHVKQSTGYYWEHNAIRLRGQYLYGRSGGVEATNQWRAGLRYERYLSSKNALFVAHSWEGDRIAGRKYQANVDLGNRLYLIGQYMDDKYLFVEAGYRFSHEEPMGNPNIDSHIIRTYGELATTIREGVGAKLWVEVMPDIANTENLVIRFEPSINVRLHSNFALKLGFVGRYDGLPAWATAEEFDYQYTTTLLATF